MPTSVSVPRLEQYQRRCRRELEFFILVFVFLLGFFLRFGSVIGGLKRTKPEVGTNRRKVYVQS